MKKKFYSLLLLTLSLTFTQKGLSQNKPTNSSSVEKSNSALFFSAGSTWKYYDGSASPGSSTWYTSSFNDAAWSTGTGQMGFGEGDEQTSLTTGRISYYFRKVINLDDVNALNDVYFHVMHDDAAIIYINNQEVKRSELMPLGTINSSTAARQSINSDLENEFFTYKIDKSVFVNGNNTIAISVRNRSSSDADLSFNCYVTPTFQYEQDGPYVFYEGGNVIVREITPNGLVSNTYSSTNGLVLTCQLPHMNKTFSFTLRPELTIEPSVYPTTPPKFLAISDFDGHIEGFTMALKGEGIVDDNFNWIYGNGDLIVTGDLFDRGFHITECMWLLYKLETEAIAQGGRVHLIIGNHEMMNLTDDWRYVEKKYFNNSNLMGKRMIDLYDENTELGRWLRTKNIIEKLGDYAFMHGGLSMAVANLNLSYQQINDYGRIEMNGAACSGACGVVNGSDGVYWYRGMADQELTQAEVDTILNRFDVKRVIFGHTKDHSIRSYYQGKVLVIDMYHVDNFENGFMKALQFELGCFHLFQTTASAQTYTQIGDCDEYTLDDSGIHFEELDQLQVYPNPAQNVLNIKVPFALDDQYRYIITDMSGKVIAESQIIDENNKIDLGIFSEGKYILSITNDKVNIKGSFMLNRK